MGRRDPRIRKRIVKSQLASWFMRGQVEHAGGGVCPTPSSRKRLELRNHPTTLIRKITQDINHESHHIHSFEDHPAIISITMTISKVSAATCQDDFKTPHCRSFDFGSASSMSHQIAIS
ncbi:hypothetical protein H4Q26_011622 [Puccinia striiformis f. sp. tritici PST-130]|nr:hypothetical protein H4Q26_011622 [Puccinia striiformis f. sp. tritici PST-130]